MQVVDANINRDPFNNCDWVQNTKKPIYISEVQYNGKKKTKQKTNSTL